MLNKKQLPMNRIIVFAIIAIAFSSCKNLVPYTDSMKKQNNWNDEQVRKIQFFTSTDVILQRAVREGSTEIVQGKIKKIDGKNVEEIVIRSGTKGVLVDIPRENKMLVSFEIDDQHYLSFGVNPTYGEKYVLLASDWNNGIGKVHYNGIEYATSPDSKYATLLVDLRKLQKLNLQQRVAKGRKVR
jgi:hypothetical protein